MKFSFVRVAIATLTIVAISYLYMRQLPAYVVSHHSMTVDGLSREYRLVRPKSWSIKKPHSGQDSQLPVVIALHGALDTTDEMAEYTGLDQLCAEKEFLLIYLQGRLLNWPPFIPAHNPDLMEPDLQFFRAVCGMVTQWNADPDRIYLVGVSQGGGMANVVAAKCSEHIAAAVCNCGWLPKPLDDTPLNTKYKCPMLFISGTNDRQVPAEYVQTAHDAFQRDGHPVVFHSIDGAGHGWNQQHGVNEVVWSFLSNHTRDSNDVNAGDMQDYSE